MAIELLLTFSTSIMEVLSILSIMGRTFICLLIPRFLELTQLL